MTGPGEAAGDDRARGCFERALALAEKAHAGQLKRGRDPFIDHVLGVVEGVESPRARIVAALHDVVEKSDWDLERLRAEGFPEVVVEAVDALTKREGETYDALVARAATNPLAREVKLADLADNIARARAALESDPDSEAERERLSRYERARDRLRGAPGELSGS